MKKLVISSLGLVAFSLPALATDLALPYKAPPPPIPAPAILGWTGFYVGATAGWLGSENNNVTNAGGGGLGIIAGLGGIPGTIGVSHSGYTGGVEVGYNWQAGPNWVLGVEEDFQGVDANGNATFASPGNVAFPPISTIYTRNLNWIATVRGRIGFLSSPGLLWYGTGGLAYGQTRFGSIAACSCSTEGNVASNISPGWTAGAGVEWRFAPAWSMKAEYLHVDLGTQTNTIAVNAPFVGTLTSSVRETDDIVRFGLNYKLY
jgi:outer membrane immunogenic protein